MRIELDPILEETLEEVDSNIENITTPRQGPRVVRVIQAIVSNAFQWFENVRLPSTLERASSIIAKLTVIENEFKEKMQSIDKARHPDREAIHNLISTLILEKISYFKEAIATQKTETENLIKSKSNYKDIQLNEELLLQMIERARTLIVSLKQKEINNQKLEEFVLVHESKKNLLSPIKETLNAYVLEFGFPPPSAAFVQLMLQSLQREKSLDYSKNVGKIWKTAKIKTDLDRTTFIQEALQQFIKEHQETLIRLLDHGLTQFVSENIQIGKIRVKGAIESEYENIPKEIRHAFGIFQNGIYYTAEWEFNKLLADLHLKHRPPLNVQKELEKLQQKWENPFYIKERICQILENDWHIANSSLFNLFEAYCKQFK